MFGEFYGFSGRPFQLTPDPGFYFESATHRKALSYLGYGLAQGEGFVVITGEAGTGKSTLAAHLAGTIDPRQLTVAQVAGGTFARGDIAGAVAQSLGLEIDGSGTLPVIDRFLHDEARAGRRCLLIVDEAQHLSLTELEELRMLSNRQHGNRALLQVLLLAQPGFRATLQNEPALEHLRQRVIAADHLEPMEHGEVEAYVVHRLRRVGWNGDPQFEPQVFAGLFETTGGIPRRINHIVNRVLLLGAVEQRERIDVAMLSTVLTEVAAEEAVPQAKTTDAGRRRLEELLAARDAQIAELHAQLARLEGKAFEHEQAIRHTLTMLIDWIEGETEQSKAA